MIPYVENFPKFSIFELLSRARQCTFSFFIFHVTDPKNILLLVLALGCQSSGVRRETEGTFSWIFSSCEFFYIMKNAYFTIERFVLTRSTKNILGQKNSYRADIIGPKFSIFARPIGNQEHNSNTKLCIWNIFFIYFARIKLYQI